jgi:hypothetical protein
MPLEQVNSGDVIFVERQEDVRIIVSIPASFARRQQRDLRCTQYIKFGSRNIV